MDHFGIGVAMKALLRTYFQSARASGRTHSLVESVQPGDRIIFLDEKDAKHVHRLLRQIGKVDVECLVCRPSDTHKLMSYPRPRGRALFDHRWIESWYTHTIEHAVKEIDEMQREFSAPDVPPRPEKQSLHDLHWGTLGL